MFYAYFTKTDLRVFFGFECKTSFDGRSKFFVGTYIKFSHLVSFFLRFFLSFFLSFNGKNKH